MESFIRDYVVTVSEDPDKSWKMLTPGFQKESGGLAKYRRFWDSATDGRVLSISANPDTSRSATRSTSTTSRTAPARPCST